MKPHPQLAAVLAALVIAGACSGSDDAANDATSTTTHDSNDGSTQTLEGLADAYQEAIADTIEVVTIDDVAPEIRPCFAASELLTYGYGVPSEFPDGDLEGDMTFYLNELPENLQAAGTTLIEMIVPTFSDEQDSFVMSELATVRTDSAYLDAAAQLEALITDGCAS